MAEPHTTWSEDPVDETHSYDIVMTWEQMHLLV
jgi:hypothetical protein